jgi:hypothetical protein
MWWKRKGKTKTPEPRAGVRWPGPGLTKGSWTHGAHKPVRLEGWRLVLFELEVSNPVRHFFEWR